MKKQKSLSIFALALTVAFLVASFNFANALAIDDETSKIPEILLQWSEYRAQGNLTELHRLRTQIVRQLELNEQVKPASDAYIQSMQKGHSSLLSTTHYLTFVAESDDLYSNGVLIAWVDNPTYLCGTSGPDNNWARLAAIGYDGSTWGEALTNTQTSGYISQTSEIYAYAKAGPTTGQGSGEWHNYLVAQVAFDPTSMWDYDFIGYAEVLSGTAQWYDLGSTYWAGTYNYASISTMSPAGENPVEKSDVMVDFAQTVTGI